MVEASGMFGGEAGGVIFWARLYFISREKGKGKGRGGVKAFAGTNNASASFRDCSVECVQSALVYSAQTDKEKQE